MLWQQWSPNWHFDEENFERTAASFDNPDFVDVVIHAYRHDFSLAAGDPACEELEERLTHRPKRSSVRNPAGGRMTCYAVTMP